MYALCCPAIARGADAPPSVTRPLANELAGILNSACILSDREVFALNQAIAVFSGQGDAALLREINTFTGAGR